MKGKTLSRSTAHLQVIDGFNGEACLIAACPHLLVALDGKLQSVLFANDAAQKFFGFKDDWRGSFLQHSVHPDDRAALEQLSHYFSTQELPQTSELEIRLLDTSGVLHWFSASFFPDNKNPSTDAATIYATFTDIAKLKAAEHLRKQQEVRLRRLGDTLPNGGIYQIIGQPDGTSSRFTYVSAGIERLLGIPADEILCDEQAIYNAIHEDDRPGVALAEKQARLTLSTYEHEFRLKARTGKIRWVLCRSAPLLNDSGELVWDGILVDITRIKNAEEALLDAKEAVERESRSKDEFLAVLSHELRTPLHAILGWTQLIRTGRLRGEDHDRGMDVIERSTRAQAELIDDLLDVSRIVSDKLRLEMDTVRLNDVMKTALASIESPARDKKVQLDLQLEALPERFTGDAGRLRQILTNLLSNAVKFTPSGGKVSVVTAMARRRLTISVKDTGIGIAPEFLPHVFERFRQANATTTRQYGGLGLGLSIVKKLVELHGGTIEVSSAGAGTGSEFTVSLPVKAIADINLQSAADEENGGQAEATSFEGLSVLIVDDDVDSQEIVKRMFEAMGAKVSTATSAKEALAVLATARPQLLVSDISMPDMDGYELLSRVRNSNTTSRRIPAIALTALARLDDRSRAEQAGFDMHVPKPVDRKYLADCVARILRESSD